MKKSNKGFFLAETIVVIALVTSIMSFVYPNVSKLYDNYKNRTMYYDQTEDLYALKAVYNYIINENKTLIINPTSDGNQIDSYEIADNNNILKNMSINKLYIVNYMKNPSSNNYNFNKYLKRLRKTTYDAKSYRLIGIFGDNSDNERYASIKIEAPSNDSEAN